MKYVVQNTKEYQKAIKLGWELPSKKGEKDLLLTLVGDNLTITGMGGGCILHSTVQVVGMGDGEVWVDGTHLSKVTALLPVGRELNVTKEEALTYQLQGYSAQDIPISATHPTIPPLGDGEHLFTGVDLSDLECEDKKAMVSLSMGDYEVVLNTRMSGAHMKVVIPTAYSCLHAFSTEVSEYTLSLMRRMRDSTIYYYATGYMGVVDGGIELIVPLATPPGDLGVVDKVLPLPTAYSIEVQQQDLLSALSWCALAGTNAITLSYTDPYPHIEVKEAGSSKGATKVPFVQADSPTTKELDEQPLVMEEANYAPTTFLSALSALPKGPITLTGKVLSEDEAGSQMTALMLTSNTGSTINVLLSPLA